MKQILYFVMIIIGLVLSSISQAAAYGGGSGTPSDPYQITNITDFQQLAATPTDWYKSFILTANLNFGGAAVTPVGNDSTHFTGVFDGNNKTISNAVIYQPYINYVGLFGFVFGGQIRNLGVENVNVTGYYYVGGLVGFNYMTTLTSCYATGSE